MDCGRDMTGQAGVAPRATTRRADGAGPERYDTLAQGTYIRTAARYHHGRRCNICPSAQVEQNFIMRATVLRLCVILKNWNGYWIILPFLPASAVEITPRTASFSFELSSS